MSKGGQGEDKATFFGRLRGSLQRSGEAQLTEPPPTVDPSLMRLAEADGHEVALFAEKATATGLRVTRLNAEAVGEHVDALVGQFEADNAIVGLSAAVGEQLPLAERLRGQGVSLIDWAADGDAAFDATLGVVDAHAALAETGTVVCASDAARGRCLSLLPPRVIVLLPASAIVADMLDYWRSVPGADSAALPSSQVFITGPSKTADIEGEMVTGVHGPGEVHVLVIDDM